MMLGTVRLRASKDMACGEKRAHTSTRGRQGQATRTNNNVLICANGDLIRNVEGKTNSRQKNVLKVTAELFPQRWR